MTNEQFKEWVLTEFRTISEASRALGIDRDTLGAMMSGVRRKSGQPVPLPKWVSFMVAGYARRRRGLDLATAQAALDKYGHVSRAAAAIGSYRKAIQDRIESGDLIKRATPHPRAKAFHPSRSRMSVMVRVFRE
jgi:hypothetical protein